MSFSGSKRKRTLTDVELYDYAIGSLARKMRTVAELKRLLRQRVEASEEGALAVEAVIVTRPRTPNIGRATRSSDDDA